MQLAALRRSKNKRPLAQHLDELQEFIQILQQEKVMSYLEIGARHGGSFHAVMMALPIGAVGIAIDLPGGPWGHTSSEASLRACVSELRMEDREAHAIFGRSNDPDVFKKVASIMGSPVKFDACFIDADHRFDGVMRDWEIWGMLSRVVGFHDIDGRGKTQKTTGLKVQVPEAWDLLSAKSRASKAIIGKQRGMGIGVLWN